MDKLVELVGQVMLTLGSAGGAAALIAALVNVLKMAGIVKDGTSPTWSFGFNLAAFLGLLAAGVAGITVDVPGLDGLAQTLATVLTSILAFAFQLKVSPATHEAIKTIPVVGKSYAVEKGEEAP